MIEQFDTLPIQCRRIELMHEGVWLKKKNSYIGRSTPTIAFDGAI